MSEIRRRVADIEHALSDLVPVRIRKDLVNGVALVRWFLPGMGVTKVNRDGSFLSVDGRAGC